MGRRSALRGATGPTPPVCRHVKILLLEDDPAFRAALDANLTNDGHEVVAFASPRFAPPPTELADAQLVITDQVMAAGDLTGLEFADAFHVAHPEVPVVLVTSCAAGRLNDEIAARSFVHLRRKPIDYDDLQALLHRLVA